MIISGDMLREYLKKADKNGFAVPAFNYSDVWDMLAIIEAAKEENAPIMLASNPLVVRDLSVELCGAMGVAVMKKESHPVFHHLDHSSSVELCCAAIDNGYPSVMIDASKYTLEENIVKTKTVVEYAKAKKVHVEAEIGKIRGGGIEGAYSGSGLDFLAKPDEAKKLAVSTGIDSLAVGIGTAHGFYVGKPEIFFDRLAEINEVIKIPLVLHGGTGITQEDIRKAIKNGINKVNVGTIIHCTYMNSMKKTLNELPENPYTLDVVRPSIKAIKEVVKGWIKVCMADNKM